MELGLVCRRWAGALRERMSFRIAEFAVEGAVSISEIPAIAYVFESS